MLRRQARLFGKQNLISDFLRGNAELGDIYQLDDKGWVVVTNIFRLLPQLELKDYVMSPSPKKDISYTTATGTEVKFSGNATSGQIGELQAEISFSQKNSAFASLKQVQIQGLDLEKIRPEITRLWQDLGYNRHRGKFFFVNQVFVAETGVTIFSEDRNNAVKLQSKLSKPLTTIGMIGEGKVEIVANKKETLEVISDQKHTPLFQAVRQKPNGLWELLG